MLVITLFLILCTLIYFYCKKKLNYWNELGVPNLNPRTPLGDAIYCFTRGQNINQLFKDFALEFKKQGHRFYGFYLGFGPIFVPTDYELIKTIFTTDSHYFPDRGAYIEKAEIPLSDNFFCAKLERKRYMIDMIQKSLTPKKIKSMLHIIENYSNIFCKKLDESNGKPIRIFDLSKAYVLDVACSSFFGVDEENLLKGTAPVAKFSKNMHCVTIRHTLKVLMTNGLSNPAYIFKAFLINKEISEFLYDYCERLYKLRKKSKSKRQDLLSCLIDAYEDENQDFDIHTFAGQVLMILLGTFETDAYAITYVLYQLGLLKDYQEKVREEITKVLEKNNQKFTPDVIGEMTYFDRVMTECLRVHTIVATVNRFCVKDYKIPHSNVVIKEGTPTVVSYLGIHNDPEYFPEPEKFDPDRFLDADQKQHMCIFGFGLHRCIGSVLAKLIVKIVVANVLLNYDVHVNEMTGSKLENVFFSRNVSWTYKNTFWLEFKKRK